MAEIIHRKRETWGSVYFCSIIANIIKERSERARLGDTPPERLVQGFLCVLHVPISSIHELYVSICTGVSIGDIKGISSSTQVL